MRERKRVSCLPLMQQKSVITFKRVCQVLGMNIWRWLSKFFVWGKTVSLSFFRLNDTLCLFDFRHRLHRQTDCHWLSSLVEKCDRSIRVWNYASMKFFRKEEMFLSVSYIDPPFSCQGSVSFSWVIHGHQKAWSEKREKGRKRRRRANGGHSSPSSSLSLCPMFRANKKKQERLWGMFIQSYSCISWSVTSKGLPTERASSLYLSFSFKGNLSLEMYPLSELSTKQGKDINGKKDDTWITCKENEFHAVSFG